MPVKNTLEKRVSIAQKKSREYKKDYYDLLRNWKSLLIHSDQKSLQIEILEKQLMLENEKKNTR